ncbi:hypothetical protein MTO96_009544 [Rhipicephalus appendiculatus]
MLFSIRSLMNDARMQAEDNRAAPVAALRNGGQMRTSEAERPYAEFHNAKDAVAAVFRGGTKEACQKRPSSSKSSEKKPITKITNAFIDRCAERRPL